jgi:transcriptional regulator with XRE-family HTH domain
MQVPQPEAPSDDEAAKYARELRRWRERRGLSKKALAELMANDRTYVSHIEGCSLAPTEDFTRRAEDALNAGGALWGRWQALTAARALTDPPATLPSVDRDLRTVEFVAWLADHSSTDFRATYEAVAALAHRLDGQSTSAHHARSHERANVSRADVAAAIATYYGSPPGSDGRHSLYRASVAGIDLTLSILVEPSWLGS